MGTRGYLVIKCPGRKNIYLYMRWDCYFSGQGDDLCKKLSKLLNEFTEKEIVEKVLKITEYDEDPDHNNMENEEDEDVINSADDYEDGKFTGNFLYKLVKGEKRYKFDEDCIRHFDIEYAYEINLYSNFISVKSCGMFGSGKECKIPFKLVKNGVNFSDFEECFYHDEENEN